MVEQTLDITESEEIKVAEFISVAIFLAEESGKIIR